MPSPRKTDAQILSKEAVRYWLATLSYEEALAARPKARRSKDFALGAINLQEPATGQDYAKVPFAGAEKFLVERRGELSFELSSELCGFFEHWLVTRYRRGGDEDENGSSQLVSFPTLHLPSDELAGLLRFPVELEWVDGERTFVVPSYAQRKRGEWPTAPTRGRLKQPASEPERILPFFIDARVLRDTLRVDSERIDDFFAELRENKETCAQGTVQALCELLEEQNAIESTTQASAASPLGESASARRRNGARPVQDAPGAASPSEEPVRHSEPSSPGSLLVRLVAAVSARIALVHSRARVYGVALVLCTDQTRATWHLQKDLHQVEDALEAGGLDALSPLHAYLTGSAPKPGRATCWGRWRGAGLTNSQREACELSLGSTLAAVQGPPGTGKTTLILNLLAHTLVQKVATLARSGKMGLTIAVVTSTNNRAVDNVVDPLGRDLQPHGLPLALRAGSRQIVERVTLSELQRVRQWLQERNPADLHARPLLEAELAHFNEVRAAMESRLSREQVYHERLARRHETLREIAEIRSKLGGHGVDREQTLRQALHELSLPPGGLHVGAAQHSWVADSCDAGPSDSSAAIEAFLRDTTRHAPAALELRFFATRLEALSELAGRRGRLGDVKRHWKQTRKRALSRIRSAFGFEPFPDRLPTVLESASVEEALEAWEEAAERLLTAVRDLEQLLVGSCEGAQTESRLATLQRELAGLETETAAPPPAISDAERAELDRQHLELFESAVRVREAWAAVHRADLSIAIDRAIRTVQDTRSLRSLMDNSKNEPRWLRELFPAWGCTLLSLGNVFPSERHGVDRIVIDEAGQCHPAYAVSALLRADSALIIGDTNQLEPVVGLSIDDERRIVRGLELEVELEKLAPFRAYDGSMTSAQSLADRAFETCPVLVDHFRCQREIAAICEALCQYGLVTRTARRTRADLAPFLTAPVLLVTVDGAQERFAGSWMNEAEARVTLRIVQDLLEAGIRPNEIGVITPYRGQLERLWRRLRELGVPLERPSADLIDTEALARQDASDQGLAVGTVHRFQGGERSVILFTTTVTEARSLKFVDERVNLVNVAASRARDHLITIGHGPTLGLGRHTRRLLEGAVPFIEHMPASS